MQVCRQLPTVFVVTPVSQHAVSPQLAKRDVISAHFQDQNPLNMDSSQVMRLQALKS